MQGSSVWLDQVTRSVFPPAVRAHAREATECGGLSYVPPSAVIALLQGGTCQDADPVIPTSIYPAQALFIPLTL